MAPDIDDTSNPDSLPANSEPNPSSALEEVASVHASKKRTADEIRESFARIRASAEKVTNEEIIAWKNEGQR